MTTEIRLTNMANVGNAGFVVGEYSSNLAVHASNVAYAAFNMAFHSSNLANATKPILDTTSNVAYSAVKRAGDTMTGDLTVANADFKVTGTSSRVGIRTLLPNGALDVNGDIAVSGVQVIDQQRRFHGDGCNVSNINATNVTSGTLAWERLPAATITEPGAVVLVNNATDPSTAKVPTAAALTSVNNTLTLVSGLANATSNVAHRTSNVAFTTSNVAFTTSNLAFTTSNVAYAAVKRAGDTVSGTLQVNGNIGINVAPATALHVNGVSTFSGNLLPSQTEVYSIGTSNMKFKDIHLSGNTIYLGDTKIGVDSNTNTVQFVDTQNRLKKIVVDEVQIGTANPVKLRRDATTGSVKIINTNNGVETEQNLSGGVSLKKNVQEVVSADPPNGRRTDLTVTVPSVTMKYVASEANVLYGRIELNPYNNKTLANAATFKATVTHNVGSTNYMVFLMPDSISKVQAEITALNAANFEVSIKNVSGSDLGVIGVNYQIIQATPFTTMNKVLAPPVTVSAPNPLIVSTYSGPTSTNKSIPLGAYISDTYGYPVTMTRVSGINNFTVSGLNVVYNHVKQLDGALITNDAVIKVSNSVNDDETKVINLQVKEKYFKPILESTSGTNTYPAQESTGSTTYLSSNLVQSDQGELLTWSSANINGLEALAGVSINQTTKVLTWRTSGSTGLRAINLIASFSNNSIMAEAMLSSKVIRFEMQENVKNLITILQSLASYTLYTSTRTSNKTIPLTSFASNQLGLPFVYTLITNPFGTRAQISENNLIYTHNKTADSDGTIRVVPYTDQRDDNKYFDVTINEKAFVDVLANVNPSTYITVENPSWNDYRNGSTPLIWTDQGQTLTWSLSDNNLFNGRISYEGANLEWSTVAGLDMSYDPNNPSGKRFVNKSVTLTGRFKNNTIMTEALLNSKTYTLTVHQYFKQNTITEANIDYENMRPNWDQFDAFQGKTFNNVIFIDVLFIHVIDGTFDVNYNAYNIQVTYQGATTSGWFETIATHYQPNYQQSPFNVRGWKYFKEPVTLQGVMLDLNRGSDYRGRCLYRVNIQTL